MKCAHDKSGNKDNKMCRSVTGISLRATGRGVESRVTSTPSLGLSLAGLKDFKTYALMAPDTSHEAVNTPRKLSHALQTTTR